jgi:hypothetical protein
MRLLKNKRGGIELPLKPIREIIIAVIIFFTFVYVGKAFGSGEIFQKVRLSAEFASSANTLYDISDNAYFFYTEDIPKYTIDVDPASIKLSKFENDPAEATHFFVKNKGSELDTTVKNPEILVISKSGDKIEFSDKEINLNKQRCPSVQTTTPSKTTIIPKTEQGQVYEFTNALSTFIQDSETRDLLEIKETQEMLLQITTMQEQNTIRAYIAPNLESRKLACLIINNLLQSNPDLTNSIIPSDQYPLIMSEKGVLLELSQELENQNTITSIKNAFDEYSR